MSPHTSAHGYWGGGWASRFMNDVALVLTQACTVVSGLLIVAFAGLTFFGEPLKRPDYVDMAIGLALSAVLLLLSLVPARARRCSGWVTVLALVLATSCLVGAGFNVRDAVHATPVPDDAQDWWRTVGFFFMLPTTWPVFLLLARATLGGDGQIRDPSSPEPRPLQDR